MLDVCRIGAAIRRAALVAQPILHDHGNAGGTTGVFLLLYEGDVEPDGGWLGGECRWDYESADNQQHENCQFPSRVSTSGAEARNHVWCRVARLEIVPFPSRAEARTFQQCTRRTKP